MRAPNRPVPSRAWRGVLCVALLLSALRAPAAAAPEGEGAPAGRPALVVIAPAAWRAALEPYVALRRRELDVETPSLESVLAQSPGGDAPEKIKRFLHEGWRERRVRYALLVGDADVFPVRFMVLDRVTPAAFDTAFYASDLYYADVAEADGSFDDWNDARDGHHAGYVGEVQGENVKRPPIDLDGVSYLPEIAVGRWPVSRLEDLSALVAKTVAFEPRAAAGAARRALLLHAEGWVDARARVGGWGTALSSAGWTVETQLYGGQGPAAGQPSPASVLGVVARGVELVLHAGHGCGEGWPGSLGRDEEPTLAGRAPAIYASAGCSTAAWTVEPPYGAYRDVDGQDHRGTNAGEVFDAPPPAPAPLQPPGLAVTSMFERLLRAPGGGAVAYVGCCTGSQPCALTLIEGLALSLARPAAAPRRLGDAWNAAVARYHEVERLADLVPTESWYPPSVFFQGMKFLLLGDPALPLP